MATLSGLWQDMEQALHGFFAGLGPASETVTYVLRFLFPLLGLVIFLRCLLPLMTGGQKSAPWGWLAFTERDEQNHITRRRVPLVHWETAIGSGKTCDIVLDSPKVAKAHAVLTRRRDIWVIYDLTGRRDIKLRDEIVEGQAELEEGDSLRIAGKKLTLLPPDAGTDEPPPKRWLSWITAVSRRMTTGATLTLIVLFQLLGLVQNLFARADDFDIMVPVIILLLIVAECLYTLFTNNLGRRQIEPELLAFFLSGIGLFVIAAVNTDAMLKQFCAILLGLFVFLALTYFLNNIERARVVRYIAAAGAIVLLLINLLIAPTVFGARNWISLGPVSIQPSEFVKVAFVFAGAATLERLLTRRNLLLFMGYAGACVGMLVLMRDLGTAVVFYMGFVVMGFMRSGDARTIGIVSALAVAGGFIAMSFLPYIQTRFSTWRHAWDFADTGGYQQTRTMVYTASGGLLGVGSGNGYLRNVAAADTDLVFGVVAEEWGLILALICALAPLTLAVFSAMSVRASRSAFYAIAACGASAILLTQAALNVFGSLDLLPLTGVTLPFISNGGSSMVTCWGLLACIKSIDERHRAAWVRAAERRGQEARS